MTSRINSVGVLLSTDTIPVVTGVSTLAVGKDIRIKDKVVAIDGISLLDQPASFYRDTCIMHDGKGVIQQDESLNTVKSCQPSDHARLLQQFAFRNDTATLSISRDGKIYNVTLTRGNKFTDLPDTVVHYADEPPAMGYIVKRAHTVNDDRGHYYLLNTNRRPFREEDYR